MDSTVTQEFVPHAQDPFGVEWKHRRCLEPETARSRRILAGLPGTQCGGDDCTRCTCCCRPDAKLGMRNSNPNSTSRKIRLLLQRDPHYASVEVFNNSISNYIYNEKLASVTEGFTVFAGRARSSRVQVQ